jgi:hypothetical protein
MPHIKQKLDDGPGTVRRQARVTSERGTRRGTAVTEAKFVPQFSQAMHRPTTSAT